MLIVVAFLVVKIFGVLAITRHHDSLEGRHLVGILPTDLPELSKPKFQRSNRGKNKMFEVENSRSRKNLTTISM